jgi:hypothetical protein
VGPGGLDNAFGSLDQHQEKILRKAGMENPADVRIVYNNIIATTSGLSPAAQALRESRRKDVDGPAACFMAYSIGGVVAVGGVALPVEDELMNDASNDVTPDIADEE